MVLNVESNEVVSRSKGAVVVEESPREGLVVGFVQDFSYLN